MRSNQNIAAIAELLALIEPVVPGTPILMANGTTEIDGRLVRPAKLRLVGQEPVRRARQAKAPEYPAVGPTHYIVMSSSCKVAKWGRLMNLGVCEVRADMPEPKFMGEHAKGFVRFVHRWTRLNLGKTERCEYARVRREAEAEAARRNAGRVGVAA